MVDSDVFACPKGCSAEKTNHSHLRVSGDYNEIYHIKCENCGHEHAVHRHDWLSTQVRERMGPRKAYLTKYPRPDPHTGEMVNSKEHQESVWKKHGFKCHETFLRDLERGNESPEY